MRANGLGHRDFLEITFGSKIRRWTPTRIFCDVDSKKPTGPQRAQTGPMVLVVVWIAPLGWAHIVDAKRCIPKVKILPRRSQRPPGRSRISFDDVDRAALH